MESWLEISDFQILIPGIRLTEDELAVEDGSRLLKRIMRDPPRSHAFYGLFCLTRAM